MEEVPMTAEWLGKKPAKRFKVPLQSRRLFHIPGLLRGLGLRYERW